MARDTVKKDKVVTLIYSVTDEQSEVIERVDMPVSYLHGGRVGLFDRLEAALEGKGVGDEVEVALPPEEGFGEWDPDLSFTDALENVPPQYRQLGAQAEFMNDAGETRTMVVTHVDSGTVTLDGNHPFAGKTVTFHITVQAIRNATPQEIRSGEAMPEPGMLH